MDQKCVETSVTLEYHLLHFYLLGLPIARHTRKIKISNYIGCQLLSWIRMRLRYKTNHNHHAFLEKLLRDEHPKQIINEGTTEKNLANLIRKTIESYNMSILFFIKEHFRNCRCVYLLTQTGVRSRRNAIPDTNNKLKHIVSSVLLCKRCINNNCQNSK